MVCCGRGEVALKLHNRPRRPCLTLEQRARQGSSTVECFQRYELADRDVL